ncbi:MAG: TIGR02099 family protein [Burkholderiales bacterium]|nr:TIGR02099 family protein [Burkholderiales bacterium]
MKEMPPLPSRALKLYAAAAKASLWLLLAAWLVLAGAWGALHGWIVPRIGELRPEVEMEAARALGVPVRIGSITARTEGLIPSFELRDVVLLDPQGREALRLPRVLAALSPRSVWNLGFEQLYIDAPELDIRRDRGGRMYVAGLDFSRSGDNEGQAAEWFFRQAEFVIRGGTLRWTDELRGAPPLALSDVDFVVRNRSRRHSMRLDATPPAEWGDRFRLAGMFRQPLLSGRDGRWQEWVGQLHAEFSRVDLSQLRRHADLGVRIGQGVGALRAWADIDHGQLVGGTADVVLTGVEATLGPKLEPLALQSVSGRLGGKRLAGGFEFQTHDLQFQTVEGQRWPGGNVYVAWTAAQGQAPSQGELRADRLDLSAVSQVASRLPLGTATHAALTAYSPKGLVETLQARWQGPLDALQKYEARGRASGLEVAAQQASPGLRGGEVEFDFTQAGGRAKVQVLQGALDLPRVFEEPVLPLDTLAGELQWQLNGEQASVQLRDLKFSNADAQGEATLSWRTGEGAARLPGVLDLQGSLSRADGARVFRYLPLAVGQEARHYVRDSVQQGTATGAKFRVRGDLRHFPFADPASGEFLITAKVQDVLYAYVPRTLHTGAGSWPALVQLAGELVFQGNGMEVRNASGRFAGAPGVQVKVQAKIPDFRNTVVGVQGQFRGPLAESLGVVNQSPLADMSAQALAKARGTGAADVKLQLSLPIQRMERSTVLGTVTLANNDLQVTPDSPLLTRARGSIVFNERGFQLVGAQARALGGDVRIEGGTRAAFPAAAVPVSDAPIVLRAQGTATAEGLRQATELGFVSRVARDMTGSTPYSMVLGVRSGTPELLVTSSLQGLAVQLPAPFGKAADTQMPLRYETALVRESLQAAPGSTPRVHDRLMVELGRVASVNYLRDLSGPEARVLRGAISVGVGEPAVVPEQGVMANILLAQVDIDAWEQLLERLSAGGGAVVVAGLRSGGADSPAMSYLPTQAAVRTRQLRVEGRTLNEVVVGGSRDGLTWRANIDAQELSGYIEYRQPSGAGAGRVYARLARLGIAAADAREVEALLDQQPANIPALDIVVDDFELRGKKLGKLEIEAVNRGAATVARDGGIREWRLTRLALSTPESIFTASGNWAAIGAQAAAPGGPRPAVPSPSERRRTVMNFKLDIADAGGTLARFGMRDVVRRGRGKMEGQVAWLGSPLSLDYPTLQGSFNVNVESGQFLKADAGIAKLLGVLSLQSLPRRLALDFRDVFSEGFAFDFLRGDVTIQQGIASTNNLQMKGVTAAVLMDGKADIARETQDIRVVVVPEINAGTASLVATVINPAIGLGSFLAQMFLRQPLMRAATQEFHIDGTWADPRVTRVARTPTAGPAAAAGEVRQEAQR